MKPSDKTPMATPDPEVILDAMLKHYAEQMTPKEIFESGKRFFSGKQLNIPDGIKDCFLAYNVNEYDPHVFITEKLVQVQAMNVEILHRIELEKSSYEKMVYLVFEDENESLCAIRITPELLKANP